MSNSVPSRPRNYRERFPTARRCFFICVVQLMAAGGAFAENARTPLPDAAATSPYLVDGLALGARVDFELRLIVATNAARVNCFLTLCDVNEPNDSRTVLLAALSKQPTRSCTIETGKRFM